MKIQKKLAKIYKACDNPKIKHGMFSATISNEVEEWCKSYMNNLVQINIGRKLKQIYNIYLINQSIIYLIF